MRRPKYRKPAVSWGVVGRLASGCSHMVPITRERAKVLLRSHTGRRMDRWARCGSREWNLPFASTKEMASGYTFGEMYVYAIR